MFKLQKVFCSWYTFERWFWNINSDNGLLFFALSKICFLAIRRMVFMAVALLSVCIYPNSLFILSKRSVLFHIYYMNIYNTNEYMFLIIYTCINYNPPMYPYNYHQSILPGGGYHCVSDILVLFLFSLRLQTIEASYIHGQLYWI